MGSRSSTRMRVEDYRWLVGSGEICHVYGEDRGFIGG